MNALLLVCSSFAAVISLLTASRTQVVYWAMMFIVIYMLFKNMFSNKLKKLVLTGAIAIGSLGVTYFTIVTIARFENTSLSAQEGLVSYIGQPYLAFTNVYNHYTFDKITLNRTFPVTSKWVFGDKTFNITDYRERQTNRIGADTNVFYTYLGDAMLDYGKVGMILYSLLFYFICSLFFSSTKKRELSLSKMIVLVLLLRVPTLGLFAYMYASVDYSVLLFGSLFMAFLLK
jgi:oligosaccharide repeat unit polymerase